MEYQSDVQNCVDAVPASVGAGFGDSVPKVKCAAEAGATWHQQEPPDAWFNGSEKQLKWRPRQNKTFRDVSLSLLKSTIPLYIV